METREYYLLRTKICFRVTLDLNVPGRGTIFHGPNPNLEIPEHVGSSSLLVKVCYKVNEPNTNIDAAGLIGIPCPGTAAFTIFLDKLGESAVSVLSSTSRIVEFTGIFSSITNASVVLTKTEQTVQQINGQLITASIGSTQPGPGNGLDRSDFKIYPPIFWDELWYPDIERIDYTYYVRFAPESQKLEIPELPNFVFLVFHKGDPSLTGPNRDASKALDPTKLNTPNGDFIQVHEVPYASTIEGGKAPNLRMWASRMQNRMHGVSLQMFYSVFKINKEDEFLVPLEKPVKEIHEPAPVPTPNILREKTLKPSGSPGVKPIPLSPIFLFELIEANPEMMILILAG